MFAFGVGSQSYVFLLSSKVLVAQTSIFVTFWEPRLMVCLVFLGLALPTLSFSSDAIVPQGYFCIYLALSIDGSSFQ